MARTDALITGQASGADRTEGVRATLRLTSQGKIIGQHPGVRDVVHTVERVASSTCTVLITGENGTGKELVVAALHDASPRAAGPLVTVNCGTIPEALIESHLFGHARGAYAGAVTAHRGFVAAAEGGTLFLDEIGELPLLMQVKFLRLLQQREYLPVGDTRTVHCDIRVVAASNRDLEAEAAAGRFREDLFYRINVVHVTLPPLRDRPGDIELLAMHFLKMVTARNGRTSPVGIDPGAMRALREFPWPGNIRQLENAIERAVLLAPAALVTLGDLPPRVRDAVSDPTRSTLLAPATSLGAIPPPPGAPVSHLPPDDGVIDLAVPKAAASPFPPPALPEDGVDLSGALESFENSLIVQALQRTRGNRNRAAQLLRINRTTLIEKIRRRRLDV